MLSESTFPYKHPHAAPLASMRRRRSLSVTSLAPPYFQRLQINTPPLPPQCRPLSHQLEWAAIGGPGLLDHQVESLFGYQVLEFGQVLGDDRVPP